MKIGIRYRLTVVMLVLTIIPLIVTSYFLARVNEEALRDQILEYNLTLSAQLAEISDELVQRTCSDLGEITLLLNDQTITADQTIRLAGYQIGSSKHLEHVNIYDEKGQFLDSFLPENSRKPAFTPSELPENVLENRVSNRCLPGEVLIHEEKPFLVFVYPWKEKQTLHGYLWTAVNIEDISITLDRYLHEGWSGKISAYLVDAKYSIVAHPEWSDIVNSRDVRKQPLFQKIFNDALFPKAGVGIAFDYQEGTSKKHVNLTTLPSVNWILVVQQSWQSAYKALDTMQRNIVILGSVLILLTLLVGTLVSRRLTRPIQQVADGARKLAERKFDHRIDFTSRDEIGDMAETFNFLAQSMQDYDARIQEEVSIRTDLSRYLTTELVEAIVDRKADLNLGGQRQKVAVLYADIVSFTPLSESRDPETVVTLLNELFTILTQIIFRNNGMIDKFIGDCVMALFGAPNPDEKAADNAVKTAEEMIRWLEVGNRKWQRDLGITLQLAISINYGEVIIGNIGSEKRMEFTAIGDTVNTAARLEKIARENQILITEDVSNALQDKHTVQPVGRFELRGKDKEVAVFEVLP